METIHTLPSQATFALDSAPCKDGDVGVAAVARIDEGAHEVETVPFIFKDKHWFPICGLSWANNSIGVSTYCQKMGFEAGQLQENNRTLTRDAMTVGLCRGNDTSLDACSGGDNFFGQTKAGCKKDQHGGVKVKCSGKPSEKTPLRNSCWVGSVSVE